MELLTVRETAAILRVAPITVRRYIATGRLPAVRVGRNVRIDRDALPLALQPVSPARPERTLEGPTDVVRVEAADEERALEIIRRHEDKDFSLTDATSFAVMSRLGIREAFAFDRHFARYGFVLLEP